MEKGYHEEREEKSDIYHKRKGKNSGQFNHTRLKNKFYEYKLVKGFILKEFQDLPLFTRLDIISNIFSKYNII